jgi:hypothetical protein
MQDLKILVTQKTADKWNTTVVCLREFEMKLPKTVTDGILYRLNCENKSPREIVRLAQRIIDSLSV